MGRGIAFMVADVGATFPPYIFATDAQGEGEGDRGGYGSPVRMQITLTGIVCARPHC